jgi:hypothetical protein
VAEVLSLINTANVLAIVSSIGLSIVFAFVFGSAGQFVTRLIFTFDYETRFRRWGGLYCAAAITLMTYFILVKGAKGSVLISAEQEAWIMGHIPEILGAGFLVSLFVWQVLIQLVGSNVLRGVVLIGTFALALAFAANDLVNFIGPSMAALAAYTIVSGTPGAEPSTFLMGNLAQPVSVNPLILMAAGVVMVITLWLSKKARSVASTELTLGRQEEGVERFEASGLSRGLVRMGVSLGGVYAALVPSSARQRIARRLDAAAYKPKAGPDGKLPAFDPLRAAVNLTVASALISFGTSMKLPLSTTFITFMVAMSTSLVDGAWGRESAVYRVNGVITVVGGWFFTGFMAFTASFLFALAIYFGELPAILGLIALGIILFWRTVIVHRKREFEFERLEREREVGTTIGTPFSHLTKKTADFVAATLGTIDMCYDGLIKERRKRLKEARARAADLAHEADKIASSIFHITRFSLNEDGGLVPRYAQQIASLQIISANLQSLTNASFLHIDNNHHAPDEVQAEELRQVYGKVESILRGAAHAMETRSFGGRERLTQAVCELKESIRGFDKNQMKRMKAGKAGTRQSLLFIGTMSKAERIADQAVQLLALFEEAMAEEHG